MPRIRSSAARVIGLDMSADAIGFAKEHYRSGVRSTFLPADLKALTQEAAMAAMAASTASTIPARATSGMTRAATVASVIA